MTSANFESPDLIPVLWSAGKWEELECYTLSDITQQSDRARLILFLISSFGYAEQQEKQRVLIEAALQWQVGAPQIAAAIESGILRSLAKLKAMIGDMAGARDLLIASLATLLPMGAISPLIGLHLPELVRKDDPNPDWVSLLPPSQKNSSLAEAQLDFVQAMVLSEEAIGPVLQEFPVNNSDGLGGFALIRRDHVVLCAYYDPEKRMIIAKKATSNAEWERITLDQSIGWDSHNYIAMGIDRKGYLHLCGNMHCVPLVYYRSEIPLDITSLRRQSGMVGAREDRVTYPKFFLQKDGVLCFSYRDGMSGNGATIINRFDEERQAWQRVIDKPLTDGEGLRNAYIHGPVLGPDGYFHICWVWRDTPDASTNHKLSYARSRDLVNWENADSLALVLPLRVGSPCLVDNVAVGSGMINNNHLIGFDSAQRPLITYQKFDQHGSTQLFMARRDETGWTIRQITNWSYRWDFKGMGSLNFEITFSAPYAIAGGLVIQEYDHVKLGSGSLILSEDRLEPIGWIGGSIVFPGDLVWKVGPEHRHRSNIAQEWGGAIDSGGTFDVLQWESMPESRDKQPPASMTYESASPLRLIHIRKGSIALRKDVLLQGDPASLIPSSPHDLVTALTSAYAQICNLESRLYAEVARNAGLEQKFRNLNSLGTPPPSLVY